MGITINNSTLGTDKVILPPVAITPPEPPKKGVNDNKLYSYVERQIDNKDYTYLSGQNIIIDNKGIIHIYLDENGNPIYSYYPVAAKENIDKFQFHIVSKNSAGYVVESDAELKPIEISEEVKTNVSVTHSDGSTSKTKYSEYQSSIFGPYTTSFPFTISKTVDGSSTMLVDRTIKLLKTSRVSIGTAVVATWLKNPENITTFRKPNGDSTLIADNKNTRGFLGLFLTFHIIPRNLNIQPRNIKERLGITVGTNLSDKAFANFFLGLNVEVTNGLFLNFGTHFGQVSYAVGYDKFKFGDDKFTGTLETRKKWQIGGPYVAINIDAALFAKVFKNILGNTAN